ncbi:UDP-glycosyltransferase UGT4-like [Chrysoperla carnea]|uniref:UDP-glycosyltransferase UGT4-like n=1 Tax=Chrysoperla carnea TaxID=189513 RepID=UPI001D05F5A0|nr:UDP-glycosyltransferase UGT4-like [Chrysoperla carnea]
MFLKLNYIIVILLWLCLVNFILSARILFVGIAPSLSHHIFFRHLIKELAFRGHHVVSITPDPINDPELINITEIDTHNETYGVILTQKWLESVQYQKLSEMNLMRLYLPLFHEKDDKVLSAPKVQELIHNPNEHFDVVIVEWLMVSAHYFGFRERFNCPSIGVASLDTTINVMDAIGNSPDPNYYGSFFTEFSGGNLNFWERLQLLWHHIDFRYYYYFQYLPGCNKLLAKHFNVTNKSAWDLEKSVDLLLTNTNPIFHIPRPKVPTYIDIGGMHLADRKPLPKDLKKFLDDSKQGVIYFSLGSNVQSTNLPDDTRTAILDVFRQLPFTVLWKWESDSLPDKPKNVITKSWFPQQDVLDHPNLKAFIMQGGIQSIEEAIRSAVPLICVPFGTDQKFNARRIADLEIGRQLSFDDITVDTLKDAITDITTNPKYKKNIQKLSEVLWDQPTKPLDRAVWWIEYVIRHGGAKHLRSPAADLPWYKYLLLDILGFIFGVAIIGLIVIVKAIKLFLKFGLYITKKIKYKVE